MIGPTPRARLRYAGSITAATLLAIAIPSAHADASATRMTAGDQQRMLSLARQLLQDRTDALVEGAVPDAPSPLSLAPSQITLEQQARAELTTRKLRLAALREAYTHAKVVVTPERWEQSGDTVLLQASEDTALSYKKITGGEPPATEFVVEHTFVFARTTNGWTLLEESSPEGGALAINQVGSHTGTETPAADTHSSVPDIQVGTPATASPARVGPEKAVGLDDAAELTASYNYTAMAQYAERYWRYYNTAYRKFDGVGGDCTNFVSQSLAAGGWAEISGWYQTDTNWWYGSLTQTYSWVGANNWTRFAAVYSPGPRVYSLSNSYYMGIGDVLQLDFTRNGTKDHTMIVTYKANGVPYLTYHSTDTYRRSLASIWSTYGSTAWLYAWRT